MIKRYNIIIIGAEKEGMELINMLKGSELLSILGVVDADPKAEGMKLAKSLGIPTSTDWKKFKKDKSLDLIINMTGKEEVCIELFKKKPANAGIIGGPASRVVSLLLQGHKAVEEDLKVSQEKYKVIIENVSDVIFQLSPKGIIQYVNPKVEELYGYKPEGLIGEHLSKTTPISEIPRVLPVIKRALSGETIKGFIVSQLDSKGKLVRMEADIAPVKRDGKIIAIQGIMRNISGRITSTEDVIKLKEAEESLKQAKEELEIQTWGLKKANEGIKLLYKELDAKNRELRKLDQLKDDFISTVSHELRTPLAITKEGLSLILDRVPGDITEKQEKILSVAKDNIERLARLINNLLDISKIESGKIVLKRKMVDMAHLVKETVSAFESKSGEKGLELKIEMPRKSVSAYIDSDKLIQVFTNLIANAMKFTQKGSITVSVTERPDEIECVVADTGKGISKEDLTKVFSKFQQFGRTAGAGEKGTGLGLSISKGIVELHKGRIWIESELNKGTQFIFTLPKYTPETLLKEFIGYGIERAKRGGSDFALLMIAVRGLDGLSDKDKRESVLEAIEDIVENAMRHTGDSILRVEEEISALLIDCDKESAVKAGDRLKQLIDNFITGQGLGSHVRLAFGYSYYPAQGKLADELIDKARASLDSENTRKA